MGKRKAAEAASDTPVANKHRAEHELTLGAKVYRLRPSYSAIMAIEEKTGHAIPELVRMGNGGAMPLRIAGTIAAELIRAGAKEGSLDANVSADKVGEMIFEHGLPGAIARLTLCLIDAATGGRKASGEAKAEATNPGESTSAD
jgi:hypothetical protein